MIRIGVKNDQSGVYRDDGGPTNVICAKQAAAEFGGSLEGVDIEVCVSAL